MREGENMEIIIFIYDFWEIISIVSVAIGFIARFLPQLPRRKENSDHNLKKIERICSFIAILGIGISAFIHIVCTKVPDVVGMDLSEARSLLRGEDLEDEFLPNIKIDSVSVNAEVNFQSISGNSIAFKNTTVFLGFAQEDNPDSMIVNRSADSSKSNADKNKANPDNGLDVSHGNEGKASVPNVLGMEQKEAIRTLYMAGLRFQVFLSSSDDINSDMYYVISQSREYGENVDIGTIVKLELTADLPDTVKRQSFEYEPDDSLVKNTDELNGFYIYSRSVTNASFYDAATNQVSSPDYLAEKLCQVNFNITGADDAILSISMEGKSIGICFDNNLGKSEIFINKGKYSISADFGDYSKIVNVDINASGEYMLDFK